MATRSPSPNPSRPKTPDFSSTLRKSKENSLRSSVPKSSTPSPASLRSSFEQKENLKSRPPWISPCSKGPKNFMAPTISAASKVITASPRKKVLHERNEVINSVAHSIEFPKQDESVCVVIDDAGSKSDVGFCFKEQSSNVEVEEGEFGTKKSQNVPPLSQDSSLPLYDPKTNYLSPRPQFLHYRPNPRIEHCFNREGEFLDVGDGRKLEDSFSSESSEDDVTKLSNEKGSEGEESFHYDVEEWVSDNETQFEPEPEPESEPEIKIKPLARRPYKRSKLVPFLLVLVLACMYAPVSDSPVNSSSALKDHIHTQSFGVFADLHLGDYLAVANVNLNGLASRIKHWSTNVGLYHFFNTTPLAADESIGFGLSYGHDTVAKQSIKDTGSEVPDILKDCEVEAKTEVMEKEVLEENTEMEHRENEAEDIEMSASEDVKEDEIGAQEIEMEVSEDVANADIAGCEMEEIIEDEGRNELEQEAEMKFEVWNTEMEPKTIVADDKYNDACSVSELEHDLSPLSYQASSIESENVEEVVDDDGSFENQSEFDKEFELLKSMNYGTLLGFSLALATLVLVSTLVYHYKKPKQIPMVRKEKRATKKAASVSGSAIAKGVMGDSGLMEVSSRLNNTLRKGKAEEEQNLSSERRLRRDSSASSSISYGSFTTYERRSAKKGGKEEEVVTPVRRSSRIRIQLTSS